MPFPKKPDGLKRVPIHVTISPQAKKRLDKLAAKTGLPISRVVDQLILRGLNMKPRERDELGNNVLPISSVGPDIEGLIERQRKRVKDVEKLLKSR